jgi:hypothetical protein
MIEEYIRKSGCGDSVLIVGGENVISTPPTAHILRDEITEKNPLIKEREIYTISKYPSEEDGRTESGYKKEEQM